MWPFSTKLNTSTKLQVTTPKNWRTGMWVKDSNNQTGILFSIGESCIVHIVNPQSGETVKEVSYSLNELRQASYFDIPECRRGITKEQAEALGYGS